MGANPIKAYKDPIRSYYSARRNPRTSRLHMVFHMVLDQRACAAVSSLARISPRLLEVPSVVVTTKATKHSSRYCNQRWANSNKIKVTKVTKMVTNRAGRGAEEAHNKQSGRAAPIFV